MVSYLELINLLQVYRISINKVQMLKICKHCGIKNPNAFNLKEFIEKVGNEDNNNKKLIHNENNQPKFVIKE